MTDNISKRHGLLALTVKKCVFNYFFIGGASENLSNLIEAYGLSICQQMGQNPSHETVSLNTKDR
jgi:hypothetical protein